MEEKIKPKKRPKATHGEMKKSPIGCGDLYVFIGADEDGFPCDVFANIGKMGGCSSQSEGISRLASLALRSGVDPDEVISELKGIKCPSASREKLRSCPHLIGTRIEEVVLEWKKKHGEGKKEKEDKQEETKKESKKEELVEEEIIREIEKINYGPVLREIHFPPIKQKELKTLSVADMVAKIEVDDARKTKRRTEQQLVEEGVCPDCGEKLIRSEGCFSCATCYFSRCS